MQSPLANTRVIPPSICLNVCWLEISLDNMNDLLSADIANIAFLRSRQRIKC